jgi:hypothetical protein
METHLDPERATPLLSQHDLRASVPSVASLIGSTVGVSTAAGFIPQNMETHLDPERATPLLSQHDQRPSVGICG